MQQTFLVKTISKKTIEVEGKLVKGTKMPQPPLWFANFEERINKRFDKQEKFNHKQEKFNSQIIKRLDKLDNRIDNLVSLNKLKESQSAKI